MIDEEAQMVALLLATSAITDQVGTDVYRGMPKKGFTVKKAIVVNNTGGGDTWVNSPMAFPILRLTCYGATESEARAVVAAVYDSFHGAENVGGFKALYQDGQPQRIADPETGWRGFIVNYATALAHAA